MNTFLDYPSNIDNAILIMFVGCEHNCPYCQNKELQDPHFNNNTRILKFNEFKKELGAFSLRNRTNKIVLSGGDPLYHSNIRDIKEILDMQGYEITIYTGYGINYVKENKIDNFTFIKTGKYDEELKQEVIKTDKFIKFASTNQELYDKNFNLLSKDGIYYFE